MKAKELAKFLLQNPEAEVVFLEYAGVEVYSSVEYATLIQKGNQMPQNAMSNSGAVGNTSRTKRDVVYLSAR